MVVPNSSKKEQTLKLIAEKDKIEQQISDYGRILEANGNVGMTGNLIDEEGFPRNDIDVYQVRHARHQIICLQNDLKELMKQIEKGLEEVHAEAAADGSGQGTSKTIGLNVDADDQSNAQTLSTPIVKVNLVSPGSPAEDAGLCVGDEIIEFGSVNSSNFQNLTTIAQIVKHKQNQRIALKVKRGEEILNMNLIPRTWSGRGMLGCNIVLPDAVER